jgi:hypothetical protein
MSALGFAGRPENADSKDCHKAENRENSHAMTPEGKITDSIAGDPFLRQQVLRFFGRLPSM